MARTTRRAKRLAGIAGSLLLTIPLVQAGSTASAVVVDGPSIASHPSMAVAPPIFSDDFSSGDFSNWTAHSSRLTIDSANGSLSAPSVRAQVTNQSAWAYRILGSTYQSACLSANVNIVSGTNVDLFSFRTASNGLIERLQIGANGVLQVRSTYRMKVAPALSSGWHNVEICLRTGPGWGDEFYLDGQIQSSLSSSSHNTGPIARIQIGDTSSATTAEMNFDDVVLDQLPGDLGPDLSPPTVPGKPTGTSTVPRTIDLSWAGSTDDRSPHVYYRIFRDGEQDQITAQWNDTTFTDTDLTDGATHTYTIVASDEAENETVASLPSDPITVLAPPSATFADDFSSGTFASWTSVTRLSIDDTAGNPSAPSARAQVSSQSAFAYRNLSAPMTTACVSVKVNLVSGSGVDLFRLRTESNGPIIRVSVRPGGHLSIRSDFSGSSLTSSVSFGSGWHDIELCGTVGSDLPWNLYYDEFWIESWHADTGDAPIGRIQIGDTAAKTFTAGFDDVVLDQFRR